MEARALDPMGDCRVTSLIEQSLALERSGEVAAALRLASNAVEEARRQGERSALARALTRLAEIRFRLGQYGAARALAREVLGLVSPSTPVYVEALLRLGSCAAETDSLTEAEACFRQAADLGRELGYPLAHCSALHGLAAGVHIPRGHFDLALAADGEAYRIACDNGLHEWARFPLMTMAWVHIVTGRHPQAHALLDELAALVTPGSWAQGYWFWLSGDLAIEEAQPGMARALYEQGRAIAEATGEPRLNIALRVSQSRYYRTLGEGPAARVWADEAIRLAVRKGYRHAHGAALIERARAAWMCGDTAAAEADLRDARTILAALGAGFDLTRARLLLAALLHAERHAESFAAWRECAQAVLASGHTFLVEPEVRAWQGRAR